MLADEFYYVDKKRPDKKFLNFSRLKELTLIIRGEKEVRITAIKKIENPETGERELMLHGGPGYFAVHVQASDGEKYFVEQNGEIRQSLDPDDDDEYGICGFVKQY